MNKLALLFLLLTVITITGCTKEVEVIVEVPVEVVKEVTVN